MNIVQVDLIGMRHPSLSVTTNKFTLVTSAHIVSIAKRHEMREITNRIASGMLVFQMSHFNKSILLSIADLNNHYQDHHIINIVSMHSTK